MEYHSYYPGTNVVREIPGQCCSGNAEKENTGCYKQVSGSGTESRLMLFSLKAEGKKKNLFMLPSKMYLTDTWSSSPINGC